jgi:AcrR family transcriptional regulator
MQNLRSSQPDPPPQASEEDNHGRRSPRLSRARGSGRESASSLYPQTKATRADWLRAALAILIADGVEQVKVLTLAQKLTVSRSSFYWYFRSRQDLLDQLLELWREKNTKVIVEQARRPAETINEGVLHIFECWTDEAQFEPRLDFAIREWARRSRPVRRIVHEADDERVEAIRLLFGRHGYDEPDAFIRARVLYFMQIGYYALEVKEPLQQRLSYVPAYLRSFTGREPREDEVERFKRITRRRSRLDSSV